MAIVIADLSTIYDNFLQKGLNALTQLQKDTEMEDEQLASASSNIIIGAMQNSVGALETLKRVELLELQKDTEVKKALDIVSTTAVRDAQSEQDLLNKAAQKTLIDNQVLKIIKDTAMTDEQRKQLILSVTYNNKIKALNSYGNMIGTMGAGGLVISSDMWSTFFTMVKGLNTDISSNPSDTTVVKA